VKLVYDIGTLCGEDFRNFRSQKFRVVGVDANIQSISELSQEFSHDPYAVCLCAAVSERAGIREFHFSQRHPDWSSLSRSIADRDGSGVLNFPVPSLTLDQMFGQFGVPHYLKLDIEGGEMDALQGMTLAAPEYLSLEFDHLGLSETELLHRLQILGYNSYAWRDQHDNVTRGYGEELIWHPMDTVTPVTSAWCDLFASTRSPDQAGLWDAEPDPSSEIPNHMQPAHEPVTLIAIRSGIGNTCAREAILETWCAQESAGCFPAFYTGCSVRRDDVDGVFNGSVHQFLAAALQQWKFDRVLFVDDETYAEPDRINSLLRSSPGAAILENGYLTGRDSGFLIPRRIAELLAEDPAEPGAAISLLSQAALLGGIAPTVTPLLKPGKPAFSRSMDFPVLTHPCAPDVMRVIHALRKLQPEFEFQVTHPHWQDTIIFYDNGAFCRQSVTDCGIWEPLEDNGALLLKWFTWEPEIFVTAVPEQEFRRE